MPGTVVDLIEIRATDLLGKPSRVDVERDSLGRLTSAVVRGVKVLGATSTNGLRGARRTRYADSALVEAAAAYNNLKSYKDHPANRDPNGERSVDDLLGILEGAKAKHGDGVYADYVVIPTHPYAETFVWLAQHRPHLIGLSHNARGSGHVQGDEFVVESVNGARSADVVTEPATTQSLFESRNQETAMNGTTPAPAPTSAPASPPPPAAGAPSAPASSPVQPIESKTPASTPAPAGDVVALFEARLAKVEGALSAEKVESDKLRVQLAGRERKERVDALLLEARLPAHAVTPVFQQQLLEAKDDASVKALLEDRKKIAWHQSPGAPPSSPGATAIQTTDQFLESIRQSGR